MRWHWIRMMLGLLGGLCGGAGGLAAFNAYSLWGVNPALGVANIYSAISMLSLGALCAGAGLIMRKLSD